MKRAIIHITILASLAGCAEVLHIPDDPELVATGPWRCLSEPGARPAPRSTEALVQVQACDFVSNCESTVSGLSARLCGKRDVGCTNPISVDIVDEGGLLSFTVPTSVTGFDGYLEITSQTALCNSPAFGPAGAQLCGLNPACNPEAPDEACEMPLYARSLLFFNPPVVADSVQPLPLPLLPSAAIPTLVEAANATSIDPTTGNIFITAVDCDGRPASGVTYGIDKHQNSVTQLYVHNGVPSDSTFETDESGVGGFFGVPPGFAEITGYNDSLEEVGAISVQVAPFTMTYGVLAPTP